MKKILVIEDAHSLRRDIIEMLSFEGYEVAGAEDGIVGVERARDLLPDLIICDIMMPNLDGYGVLETLQKDSETASIPFIFLTARVDRMDVRQGMQLGADDYLTKPFTANELISSVSTRIAKREHINKVINRNTDAVRENMLTALPHELRTPLNVILGFSDLLMSDYDSMEASRIGDMARHINNAGMRLYRLIENFLIYANIEIVNSSPEQHEKLRQSVTHNPRGVVEYAVLQKAQEIMRDADIRLDVQDAHAVQIAEDYLRKALEELIDNAAKFSEPGTPIEVQGYTERDRYFICISDYGRGMTAEHIKSVGAFMQFERKLYEQQGTGLGLAIARRVVELHDGSLTISSTPNRGTTVKIALKLRDTA